MSNCARAHSNTINTRPRQNPGGPDQTADHPARSGLAYSPGVAAACDAIVEDPNNAYKYTSRGNLVAVISNGTAVLGLGNIGPLARQTGDGRQGRAVQKFAGIDVFDIEVNENDPDKLVDIICALEPTFGGVNLEDIKAPECFYIEQKCRERMGIPVFHDDQHGTAIVSAAAVLNSLRLVNKDIDKVRVVASGAGAAAIACLELLVALGVTRANITVCDSKGVIYQGRDERWTNRKTLRHPRQWSAQAGRRHGRRRHLHGLVRPQTGHPGDGQRAWPRIR